MVLETRSALESAAVGSGHSFAATRLDAQRSIAGWIGEQTGGLSYLESIRQLAKRVDGDWDGVQSDLNAIRSGFGDDRGPASLHSQSTASKFVASASRLVASTCTSGGGALRTCCAAAQMPAERTL